MDRGGVSGAIHMGCKSYSCSHAQFKAHIAKEELRRLRSVSVATRGLALCSSRKKSVSCSLVMPYMIELQDKITPREKIKSKMTFMGRIPNLFMIHIR